MRWFYKHIHIEVITHTKANRILVNLADEIFLQFGLCASQHLMEQLAKLRFTETCNEKAATVDSVADGSLKYTAATKSQRLTLAIGCCVVVGLYKCN